MLNKYPFTLDSYSLILEDNDICTVEKGIQRYETRNITIKGIRSESNNQEFKETN